ncbi:MAG TPA: RHS repeat-associated core domain-containing protein [Candidatus Acidoferrum sp.]
MTPVFRRYLAAIICVTLSVAGALCTSGNASQPNGTVNTGTTTNAYDNVGNLHSVTAPNGNGMVHAYTYDTRNRLTNLGVNGMVSGAPGAVASYAYTLDAAGHRLSVSELSGRTVNYGYDNLYRLTSETIASDPNGINGAVNYIYDPVGNRKQLTSTLAPVPAGLWNYDANDRFTAGDTYDNDGNTVSSGGIANVYDFENHLTQKAGVTIVYDGDGNRVSKTVAGVTTKYLVDDHNPTGYAQVVYETFSGSSSGNRELNHSYVYGLELISQTRSYVANFQSAAQYIYYAYDGHGSVRAMTDPSGAVTDTYDYDAFGNLIHSTGTTPNNYLFAGEQFDPDLALYYNRARYLNTNVGRFATRDFFEGNSRLPLSLHTYLYGNADPVNRKDPAGREGDLATETGVVGIGEEIEAQQIQQVSVRVFVEIEEGVQAVPEVAEAPQTFSFLTRAIAFLLTGTVAVASVQVARSPNSSDLPDEDIAQSANYDLYRFGNAQGPGTPRLGTDYVLNGRGNIDAQNPYTDPNYRGASAFRNPFTSGLHGTYWRAPIFSLQAVPGLAVIEDGMDTRVGSSLPAGHHTIYPTQEVSPVGFEQLILQAGWTYSGKVK